MILIIVFAGLFGLYESLRYFGVFPGIVSSGVIEKKIANRTERFVIKSDENAKYSNHMDLIMSGEINGTGILCIEYSDSICYQTDTISDNFKVNFHGDWYENGFTIKYIPIKATKGELTIDYTIFGSRK